MELPTITRHEEAESSAGRIRQRKISTMAPQLHKGATDGSCHTIDSFAMNRLSSYRTATGNSVLHLHLAFEFTKKPLTVMDYIEHVLYYDLSLLGVRNEDEEIPLHMAAKYGQRVALKFILEKGGEGYTSLVNKDGDTALHLAVFGNHAEAVKELLGVSNPACMDVTNKKGETPLYLAIYYQYDEIVSMICGKISHPKHGSEMTGSTLHRAVQLENSSLVRRMLKLDLRLTEAVDSKGQTPIHSAAETKNLHILEIVLEVAIPNDVNIQDNLKRTAAHIAAEQNVVAALELLVGKSPDCFEIADVNGQNVAHYAASNGCGAALKYFFEDSEHGFCNLLCKKDEDGNTPLHLLAYSLHKLPTRSLKYIGENVLHLVNELQMKQMNQADLTPGDIVHQYDICKMKPSQQDIIKKFKKVAPRGLRNKDWQPNERNTTAGETDRKLSSQESQLKRVAKIHSSAANAIAAMTFPVFLAVGFNLNAKDAKSGGSSVLAEKLALQVLDISSTFALMFSLLALFCYFVIPIGNGRGRTKTLYTFGCILTASSYIAVSSTFMAYVYVKRLPWVIRCSIFVFFFIMITGVGFLGFVKQKSKLKDIEYGSV